MKENEAIETLISIRRVSGYSKKREEALDMAIAALEKQEGNEPKVDAAEVRHGRWEVIHGVLTPGGDLWVRCPYCRNKNTEHLEGIEMPERWNYCPNCGVKMDGGTNK